MRIENRIENLQRHNFQGDKPDEAVLSLFAQLEICKCLFLQWIASLIDIYTVMYSQLHISALNSTLHMLFSLSINM